MSARPDLCGGAPGNRWPYRDQQSNDCIIVRCPTGVIGAKKPPKQVRCHASKAQGRKRA